MNLKEAICYVKRKTRRENDRKYYQRYYQNQRKKDKTDNI